MSEGHPIVAFFEPFTAWYGDRAGLREWRRELLAGAQGRVVEIGAGAGPNFRHYPPGLEVTATEPDPHMLKRARRAARKWPGVTVEQAPAEALPFADATVDTVVGTGVLCTVPDQTAALADIRRVLKPGGRFLFFEHVRSDDPELAARQDRGERRQMRFGGGCHPNRATLAAIIAAGFQPEDVEHRTFHGPKLTRPAIFGAVRKPADG
jgi:ubiquinone/menaquinone biosynthesis C-methylase UbiE